MNRRTVFNLMSSLKLMVSHHQKQHKKRSNSTMTYDDHGTRNRPATHAQIQMPKKNFRCFFLPIFAACVLLVIIIRT